MNCCEKLSVEDDRLSRSRSFKIDIYDNVLAHVIRKYLSVTAGKTNTIYIFVSKRSVSIYIRSLYSRLNSSNYIIWVNNRRLCLWIQSFGLIVHK